MSDGRLLPGERSLGVPHDHSTHVPGCFRCELSRDEANDQPQVALFFGSRGWKDWEPIECDVALEAIAETQVIRAAVAALLRECGVIPGRNPEGENDDLEKLAEVVKAMNSSRYEVEQDNGRLREALRLISETWTDPQHHRQDVRYQECIRIANEALNG